MAARLNSCPRWPAYRRRLSARRLSGVCGKTLAGKEKLKNGLEKPVTIGDI